MHRILGRVALVALCVTLAGCGVAEATPTPSPTPTPLPTAVPTRTALPTLAATPTALPTATPSATPTAGPTATAAFMLVPRSKPADIGATYPFTLIVLCGANPFVDFDGSLWEATTPLYPGMPTPSVAVEPIELRGTMTLRDGDTALFEYPGGRVSFRRLPGPKVVEGFCGE